MNKKIYDNLYVGSILEVRNEIRLLIDQERTPNDYVIMVNHWLINDEYGLRICKQVINQYYRTLGSTG